MNENANSASPACWNNQETENPHEAAEDIRLAARRWIADTLEATARNADQEREASTLAKQIEELAQHYNIGVEHIIEWIPRARNEHQAITPASAKMFAQRYAAVRRIEVRQRVHAIQCNAREYRR
jgi:hypothetical protein